MREHEIERRTPDKVVSDQYRKHKGEWLTSEVAHAYRKKAEALGTANLELTGERRRLYEELKTKYGVTDVEAVDILNGYRISDYVDKYYRIKNLIPINRKVEKGKKKEDDEEDR